LSELPTPPTGKRGWPWTEESKEILDPMPDGSPWPKVSIVTPSYNQGEFIEETIRSVLLQGYPNLEYIIIDGGSDDGSVEVIHKYEPWLIYWVSESDEGQTHAINKGWRRATGDYVTWINSDDILFPGSLLHSGSILTRNEEIDLVYGDIMVIDPDSNHRYRLSGAPFDLSEMIATWHNPVPQQGFLMRHSLLEQIGFLDEEFQFTMDFEYWVRIALGGGHGEYLPKVLGGFRWHTDSKSSNLHLLRIADRYAILEKVFSSEALPNDLKAKENTIRSSLHLNAAHIAYQSGDTKCVRQYAMTHISSLGIKSSLYAWYLLLVSTWGDSGLARARALLKHFRHPSSK